MTIRLDLPPEIEAVLATRAEAQGLSLQQYLLHLLQEHVSPDSEPLTPGERAARWRQSAAGLPHTVPLSDEAIGRQAIYATRG